MARTLTAQERSTPTYLFEITDAATSGVSFDGMKIMMCLLITDTSGVAYNRYIVDTLDMANFAYRLEEVWHDQSYCRTVSPSVFAVTVPLWRFGGSIDTIDYQVYLYGNQAMSGARYDVDGLVATGRVAHHNILIDSGTFELTASLFPITIASAAAAIANGTALENIVDVAKAANISLVFESRAEEDTLAECGLTRENAELLLKLSASFTTPLATVEEVYALPLSTAKTMFNASIAALADFKSNTTKPITK